MIAECCGGGIGRRREIGILRLLNGSPIIQGDYMSNNKGDDPHGSFRGDNVTPSRQILGHSIERLIYKEFTIVYYF